MTLKVRILQFGGSNNFDQKCHFCDQWSISFSLKSFYQIPLPWSKYVLTMGRLGFCRVIYFCQFIIFILRFSHLTSFVFWIRQIDCHFLLGLFKQFFICCEIGLIEIWWMCNSSFNHFETKLVDYYFVTMIFEAYKRRISYDTISPS